MADTRSREQSEDTEIERRSRDCLGATARENLTANYNGVSAYLTALKVFSMRQRERKRVVVRTRDRRLSDA